MGSSHLTIAQQGRLEELRTLMASGEYQDEFQAVFPHHLSSSSILLFKRNAVGVTSLPCDEADFLALVQQGYITIVRQTHETYWGYVTP